MLPSKNPWKQRDIAILGLGVEGRSLLNFLRKCQPSRITVRDRNENLTIPQGVTAQLGPTLFENLQEHDLVLRSPGFSCLHPALQALESTRTEVSSLVRIVFDHSPCPILGVTGTKGKGTTSSLIHQMLLTSSKKSHLGGNIGTPPLEFLDELDPDSRLILELSSFQLQDLHRSPQIAVILGVTSEHLDYHADIEEYRDAKASLVRYQTPNDIKILNMSYPSAQHYAQLGKGRLLEVNTCHPVPRGIGIRDGRIEIVLQKRIDLGPTMDIALLGPHQLENVLPASLAAYLSGATPEAIREVIATFQGLPHRLEDLGEFRGRRIYDDSCSTTPETAVAALRAFPAGEVVLLLGGSEKHSDFTELGRQVALHDCRTVVYGATGPRIATAIRNARSNASIVQHANLAEAVPAAWMTSRPGDRIVLSPACASFDEFDNYVHRARFFREQIDQLHKSA